jgi:CRISPR-associated protein Cas2
MQRVLLVYDITEDKPRTKIAETCKDFGLDRIQYSTFCGKLSRNQQESLMLRLEELLLLEDNSGNIQLIPIAENDWNKRLEVHYA